MITIDRVSKTKSRTQILYDASFEARAGRVTGLLGPNGAGKSTLITILATLQRPDTGGFRLGGVDGLERPAEIRRRLGYMPQDFGFDSRMRVRDVMELMATLKGVASARDRRREVRNRLEQVELWELRDRKVPSLSGGMRRRLGLAQALIGRPRLILLDEPTAGLDPEQRDRVMGILAEVAAESVLIVSTHVAEDVRSLCPRVGILDGGVLRYDGSVADLLAPMTGRTWEIRNDGTRLEGRSLRTRLEGGVRFIRLVADSCPGPDFEPVTPVLEDGYRLVLQDGRQAAA